MKILSSPKLIHNVDLFGEKGELEEICGSHFVKSASFLIRLQDVGTVTLNVLLEKNINKESTVIKLPAL